MNLGPSPDKAIQAIKQSNTAFQIPIPEFPSAKLRTVATTSAYQQIADVRHLTDWRNRFVSAFLTQFEANTNRTGRWLADTVGPDPSKILFMIDSASGRTVGCMGLTNIDHATCRGEADAIIRGEDAPRGLMQAAMFALLTWARQSLNLNPIDIRVRSDNTPMLRFIGKCGFEEYKRVGLKSIQRGVETHWLETDNHQPQQASLTYLRWDATKASVLQAEQTGHSRLPA